MDQWFCIWLYVSNIEFICTVDYISYMYIFYIHHAIFVVLKVVRIVNSHIRGFFLALPVDIPHLFCPVCFFHGYTGWCKRHTWQVAGGF